MNEPRVLGIEGKISKHEDLGEIRVKIEHFGSGIRPCKDVRVSRVEVSEATHIPVRLLHVAG